MCGLLTRGFFLYSNLEDLSNYICILIVSFLLLWKSNWDTRQSCINFCMDKQKKTWEFYCCWHQVNRRYYNHKPQNIVFETFFYYFIWGRTIMKSFELCNWFNVNEIHLDAMWHYFFFLNIEVNLVIVLLCKMMAKLLQLMLQGLTKNWIRGFLNRLLWNLWNIHTLI